MRNINLQSIVLFFLAIYFLIAFYPIRFTFSNSYIPLGQIIPLLLVFIFSLILTRGSYTISKNIDLKLVAAFFFYVFFNAFIQSMFNPVLIEFRINSLLATIVPIFFFYVVMFPDMNDKYIKTISRYFFFGCFIFSVYYFESFASARFYDVSVDLFTDYMVEDSKGHIRVIGQRDSIYLNFALLVAIFRNYHSNYFEKILGIMIVVFVLTILIYSQTRMGYLLLAINLVVFAFISKRYRFFVFLPFVVTMILLSIYYYDSIEDVKSLMSVGNTNQFHYSIAKFKTMTDSIMSIFSSNYFLDGSTYIRVHIWKVILDEALSSPISLLFGSGELGIHSLNESILIYNPELGWKTRFHFIKTSESQYFDTIFRRGFIGLIFMFSILFRVIYLSFYLMRIDKKFYDMYIAFFIGFIGAGFTCLFLPLLRDRTFVIFFFVAYGILSSRAYIVGKLRRLNR